MGHRKNVAILNVFYRYYFSRCFSELDDLAPPLILVGGSLVILADCMIFFSPFLDAIRMSMLAVFYM